MYISSNVPKGSGVSSSAAFEVLIGVILNDRFMASIYWKKALEKGYDPEEIEKRLKLIE